METGKRDIIVNAALFQLCWFLGVVVGEWWVLLGLIPLAVHFIMTVQKPIADAFIVMCVALTGIIIDSLLSLSGVYRFAPESLTKFWSIPMWLALLWACFALTVTRSMSWVFSRPRWLFPAICMVSGPLSYFAGRRIGVVQFESSALIWMLGQWLFIGLLCQRLVAYQFAVSSAGDTPAIEVDHA